MTGILLSLFGIYLLIGLLVSVPFALFGAKRIDPGAIEGTWGFKLLIIPGAAVFWPVLLKRWLKGESAPEERSLHRSK